MGNELRHLETKIRLTEDHMLRNKDNPFIVEQCRERLTMLRLTAQKMRRNETR